jgi:hypothetical protein
MMEFIPRPRGSGNGASSLLTPRLFAQRYQLAPPPQPRPIRDKDIEEDCRDILVELDADYGFTKIHARTAHQRAAWWGFDYLSKKGASSPAI